MKLFTIWTRSKKVIIIEAKDLEEAKQKANKFYPDWLDIKERKRG